MDNTLTGAVLKVVSNDQIHRVECLIQRLCLLKLYSEESNMEGTIPGRTEALHQIKQDAAAVANVNIRKIRDKSENQDFT